MSGSDWAGLKESWERVRWARLHWQRSNGGAETARAAAQSLGMQENTYSAYERPPAPGSKHTPLDHQRANQFGRKFKVSWVWLLTGDETPFSRTPAQQRAVEMLATISESAQEEVLEVIETMVRRRAS